MKGYSEEYIGEALLLAKDKKFLPGRDLIKLLDYIGFCFWKSDILTMAAINRLIRKQNIDVFLYHNGETMEMEYMSKTPLTNDIVSKINAIIEDRELIVDNIKKEFKS